MADGQCLVWNGGRLVHLPPGSSEMFFSSSKKQVQKKSFKAQKGWTQHYRDFIYKLLLLWVQTKAACP